ncbi:MAG: WecB/TagA/CpsF family glycosyltransferase [Gemmatimonadetes bacterium]|nr:WecB/TagA/CpsF family glycosyltransferase [Gemmatimonadota bacterium]
MTQTLYVLLGAVGLLLLIACANVANLFLARGTDREREMALRTALGAGRTRMIRQLLAESIVLAMAGGAVGIGLSFVGIRAFGLFNPGGIPRLSEVAVDWRVLAFTVALSMLTGMLFGIVPAFQSAKTDVTNVLKDGAQSVTAGRHRAKLRNSLVVAEIGLALILLVGAGLLFNSFLRLQRVDPGFDSDNTTIMSLRLGTFGGQVSGRYGDPEARLRLADDLLERIRTMPGVQAAGAAVRMPFGGGRCCWGDNVVPDGGSGDSVAAWIHPVTHGMMEALGARLVAGRFPTAREMSAPTSTVSGGAPRRVAAVINHSLAERYWPNSDPVGRVLHAERQILSIVGVVENIKHFGLDAPKQFDVYVPHAEGAVFPMLDVAVRSSNDASSLAATLREAVWSIDPALPVNPPQTMNARIAGSQNGYFDEDDAAGIAEDIRSSRADILFVAITSPKKELFLEAYGDRLGVPVCHGVGGTFDIMAGKVKRAPSVWQKTGLEWLYRTFQEPRRLWKRYLVTNSVFIWMVLRELVRKRRKTVPDVS